MRRQLLISLLLLLMFLPLPTAAQSLRGTVLDRETGAPVPNARLVLLSDAGTPVSRTLSDSAGHFSIPVALKGFYSLEVSTGAHDNLDYAYSVSLTLPDSSTPLVVRLPSAEHVAATLCETPGGIVAGSVIVRDDSVIAHNVKVVVE